MLDGFRKRLRGGSGPDAVVRVDNLPDRIMEALLESDVGFDVAAELVSDTMKALGKVSKVTVAQYEQALRTSIKSVIDSGNEQPDLLKPGKKPFVILFLGINGTGKTTSIAKLARFFVESGKRVVIAASDTFRAGAIEQIAKHGENLGINVIRQPKGSDPSAVAFDAIAHAKARNADYVLIDTAGRMQTNRNLLEEMKKIRRVASPDFTILVLDSVTGQDAIEQAGTFLSEVSLDGIIMTKMDTDARGGGIISVISALKKPVLFVGTGQAYEDFMPFDADWYLDRILPKNEAESDQV